MTVAVASVPATKTITPSRFEVSGITISDIDSKCQGRDFVLSAYDTARAALPLIGTELDIAVLYKHVAAPAVDATFGFDRTGLSANGVQGDIANVKEVVGKISIEFVTGTKMLANSLKNIVIETQEDVLDPSFTERGGEEDEGDD